MNRHVPVVARCITFPFLCSCHSRCLFREDENSFGKIEKHEKISNERTRARWPRSPVGATEMLEIVSQEPVSVQVDTMYGVSVSLRILLIPIAEPTARQGPTRNPGMILSGLSCLMISLGIFVMWSPPPVSPFVNLLLEMVQASFCQSSAVLHAFFRRRSSSGVVDVLNALQLPSRPSLLAPFFDPHPVFKLQRPRSWRDDPKVKELRLR